jgi:UDP-N-acetylglucosamine--N-acetylmuramyl-(pentapeptide) pyrophosphoryl-undecaprenol N-acetylglucosamine transferase
LLLFCFHLFKISAVFPLLISPFLFMSISSQEFSSQAVSALRIGIVAGGTGGHLFPALAVVEQLQEMMPNCRCSFFGTATKIEARVIPALGFDFTPLPITALAGISLQTLLFPLRFFQSINVAYSALRQRNIQALLCAGAYMSVPVGFAARLLGIPIFLLETNAIAGKAIKALASSAHHIYAVFPEAKKELANVADKITMVGNPVRKQFVSNATQAEARQAFDLKPDIPTLLAFGGSLGARSINEAMLASIEQLQALGLQIIWQTGKNFSAPASTETMHISPFINDMATALTAADIVVCRAGASTLAELSVIPKPTLLVPYPLAANDHQRANAQSFVKSGAALMVEDSDIGTELVPRIQDLLAHPEQAQRMIQALQIFSGAKSASVIAQDMLQRIATHTHR